jgi:class 3 adenylate cyclase
MIACPSCGFEAPDDFAFCPKCAASLASPPLIAEERKVVSTLICDLVSFTAMTEAADPEDVDRILNSYAARARKAIESHGGTVEKFIGDAVVGVFGVPAVHESWSPSTVGLTTTSRSTASQPSGGSLSPSSARLRRRCRSRPNRVRTRPGKAPARVPCARDTSRSGDGRRRRRDRPPRSARAGHGRTADARQRGGNAHPRASKPPSSIKASSRSRRMR